MSWIDNILNSNSNLIEDWEELKSLQDIEDAIALSKDKAVVLFKHSTRCGISLSAKDRLESGWDLIKSDCTLYYLDLLKHRDISSEIAQKLGVVHQSPQVIIVRNKEVVHEASHASITSEMIKGKLA